MIYLDVTGRCGNQLFQYAFAKKVSQLNNNQPIFISFYNVKRWRDKTCDSSFDDQLRYLNVPAYESSQDIKDLVEKFGSRKQKKALKNHLTLRKIAAKTKIKGIYTFALRLLNRRGIYIEDECKINKPQKNNCENIFIKGYFEDTRYFDDIRGELLQEFTPKAPRKEKNAALYDIIDHTESVCVSFRVWNEVSGDLLKERSVCDKEYYEKAIEEMHRLHPNAVFIVFSNDIKFVKENFNFKYPVYFEDGDDEIYEKLRLMYCCKHFIMSTSTFCWWAQYLSRNEQKTVISPTRWTNGENESELLLDEWIKI